MDVGPKRVAITRCRQLVLELEGALHIVGVPASSAGVGGACLQLKSDVPVVAVAAGGAGGGSGGGCVQKAGNSAGGYGNPRRGGNDAG
uniref:Uncharacterized protein n=1 Tax=Oryza punctata TaxID=4537 RepID=A0A0E0M816_ORYPU